MALVIPLVLPAGLLTFNLKAGFCAGLVAVSATAAVSTIFANKEELAESIREVLDPVVEYLESTFGPIRDYISTGLFEIGSQLKEWSYDLYANRNELYEWFRNNFNASYFKQGAMGVFNKLEEWVKVIKELYDAWSPTVYEWFSNLAEDPDLLRQFIYYISEASNLIALMASVLATSALSFLQSVGGKSKGGDQGESGASRLQKLMNLINSTEFSQVKTAVWDLVKDNFNVVKQFQKKDFLKVLDFILDNSKQFIAQVQKMKSDSKWGKYKDVSEFMSAMFPPPTLMELITMISQTVLDGLSGGKAKDWSTWLGSEIFKGDKFGGGLQSVFFSDYKGKKEDGVLGVVEELTKTLFKGLLGDSNGKKKA